MADKRRGKRAKATSIEKPGSNDVFSFNRDKSRPLHFSGQAADENILMVVRRHWWFLVTPALPFIGCVILFFITTGFAVSNPAYATLWLVIEVIAFLAMIAAGAWFIYKDFIAWWYDVYIISDKQIVNAHGLFEPKRQKTPIERVQQVGVNTTSLLGMLLNFGDVRIYLTGGQLDLKNVPNPGAVRDAIRGISEALQARKPKDAPLPKPHDSDIAELLDTLAKPKKVDPLPDPDKDLPPLPRRRGEEEYMGPRRTFGGIFRVPCHVRYVHGERTVKYVQRSRHVLWRNILAPVALLVLIVPTALLVPGLGAIPPAAWGAWWLITMLIVLALLISIGVIYFDYIDDVYILTTRRVIDINRKLVFFFETRLEAEYKSVRDVQVKVPNVFERFFDIGDVSVETPGNSPDIVLKSVDHPFLLQDEIIGIKNYKDKADAAKKENDEKKMLHKWFSSVIVKLEESDKGRGTPDLRTMDLLTAMSCAQEYGLDVAIQGEAVDHPDIPPGHVVRQEPPAGTIMERGSKIAVVLSKRSLVDTM
jgi:uncharacterized membrane protein YdbT with pleckstrin-like domain